MWATESVEPMQNTAPYQGVEYFCKDCPRHPIGHDPSIPWTAWIGENGSLQEGGTFEDHLLV